MKNSIQKGILAAATVLLVLTGQLPVAITSETVCLGKGRRYDAR